MFVPWEYSPSVNATKVMAESETFQRIVNPALGVVARTGGTIAGGPLVGEVAACATREAAKRAPNLVAAVGAGTIVGIAHSALLLSFAVAVPLIALYKVGEAVVGAVGDAL